MEELFVTKCYAIFIEILMKLKKGMQNNGNDAHTATVRPLPYPIIPYAPALAMCMRIESSQYRIEIDQSEASCCLLLSILSSSMY